MKKFKGVFVILILVVFESFSFYANAFDDLPPVPPPPPSDITVNCAGDVPSPVDLTANDDVDGEITVSPTSSYVSGGCLNDFTIVRTLAIPEEIQAL